MPFQIARDGQVYGPYTLADVRRYVATANILPTDQVSGEDIEGWIPVSQLLRSPSAPPPPGAPAFTSAIPPAQGLAGETPCAEFPLFPVSRNKFLVMMIFTFGLYQLYWAYKQWVRYERQTKEPMMPWARALFAGLWNFSLFKRVQRTAMEHEVSSAWSANTLAAGILILSATSRLPYGLSALSLLTFVPYLPVVRSIEEMNQKLGPVTAEPLNTRITGWNIVAIVIGAPILLLALIGFAGMLMGLASSR